MINNNELSNSSDGKKYHDGYRIVYFYDDGTYSVGEYCKTIEGFMIGLSDIDPVEDIPEFISNEDLLHKSILHDENANSAALYNVDGTLVSKIKK